MICPKCKSWSPPDTKICPNEIDGKVCGYDLGAASAPPPSVFDRVSKQIEESVASRQADIDKSIAAHRSDSDRLVDAYEKNLVNELVEEIGAEIGMTFGDPVRDGRAVATFGSKSGSAGPDLVVDVTPPFLNLLLTHVGYTPIRRVEPRTDREPLDGYRLRVSSTPGVVAPRTIALHGISPGKPTGPIPLVPNVDLFSELDEATSGQLEFALLERDRVVEELTVPVTVHAARQWCFNSPISLAGLVTPTAPAVEAMVASLRQNFEGDQSAAMGSPELLFRRVFDQAAQVYEAIRRLDIRYLNVPPSFERTERPGEEPTLSGQKVLFPDEVIALRSGCCIDIAALTASLLERQGLRPVIVAVRGHAYAGVWTTPRELGFKEPVVEDRETLEMLVEEGSLLLWNSTTYFDGAGLDDFQSAVAAGRRYLKDLVYVLDIGVCRERGYKPVPRRKR